MNALLNLPTRWPRAVIAVVLGLAALALAALLNPGLGMNPDPYPLQKSHPSMQAYRELKRDFTGTLETALILLRHPETVYNPGTLERVQQLTGALQRVTLTGPADAERLAAFMPQVDEATRGTLAGIVEGGVTRADDFALTELQTTMAFEGEPAPGLAAALEEVRLRLYPVREVTSLANAEHIVAEGDELTVGEVYEDVPRSAAGLSAVQDAVRSNDILHRLLVAEDERATGILVETYIPEDRAELMLALHSEMKRLLEEIPGAETEHIAGTPVMSATAVATMQSDNQRFFPLVILLVLGILALTFRSLSGVLLPLSVVIISVVGTLGAMAALGVPLNIVTTAMPVFLVTIGVADGIHLVSEFRDQLRRQGGDRRAAARATLRHMALPVIMTSLTTGAGFLALAWTDISNIREFGVFVAVGVGVAMAVSLTFIPAVLSLGRTRPLRQAAPGRLARLDGAAVHLLEGVASFSYRRAGLVLAVAAVLVAGAAYGVTRVVAENDFVRYFRPEMPIVQATHALDEHLAGSNVVSVLVDAPAGMEEPFKDPALLAQVAGLQQDLERVGYVGKTLSLVDVLERINRVMHGDDPAWERLPTGGDGIPGRNVVAQYLLLYGNGGGDNLSDFTDSRFETLRVQVNLRTRSTQEIAALEARAQAYAAEHFPAGMGLRFAGSAELTTATNNEIVSGQVASLVISLALILVLLLVEFRSLSRGLLAMVPLAVTATLNFGVMGLAGIELNIGTAIVSSIVIGIGVDFAIHYMSRLQTELPASPTLEEAIRRTMHASGKAITANAVTVALGFLALAGSDMLPMRQVGWMVTQTLLVSMVATLVLLPAIVAVTQPSFVRRRIAVGLEPAVAGAGAD